jgi:hypothetical protein
MQLLVYCEWCNIEQTSATESANFFNHRQRP